MSTQVTYTVTKGKRIVEQGTVTADECQQVPVHGHLPGRLGQLPARAPMREDS